ncbi:MAG: ribosome recycling factor [Candidatus Pacebacteria bacterium]|nr:ribosome recycling factor [Candidatus Paceibacterota bacterium]
MAYDFSKLKKSLGGAEDWIKKEFANIRTGQASPAILDSVQVESYGATVPISQVAGVTIEGSRTIRITPWDMSQAKAIEKAIGVADLGLSVAVDDKGLRVNFPELTSDRRTEIVKAAKEKLEEAKKQVRAHRDETMKDLQAKEKSAALGKDDAFRYQKDAQKLVDETVKKLDDAFAKKEKEILS